MSRLPSLPFEDIRFLQVHGGKVHVIDPYQPDRDVIGFVLGDVRTLCGATINKHEGGHCDGHAEPIADFPDDWLCARCWQVTAPEERERLFEHDEPSVGGARVDAVIYDEAPKPRHKPRRGEVPDWYRR